jgi:hypothetical protein
MLSQQLIFKIFEVVFKTEILHYQKEINDVKDFVLGTKQDVVCSRSKFPVNIEHKNRPGCVKRTRLVKKIKS